MKVGDLVREQHITYAGWTETSDLRIGIVVEIDPLREHRRRWMNDSSTGVTCNEVVILLTTGSRTYVDPKRWEVINESR